VRAIILAALAAVLLAGTVAAAAPATQPATTPLLSTARLYPYVGVEQRWTFLPNAMDRDDIVWHVGCAYSLGAFAPSLTYRWNPEPGSDINEIALGVRVSLRGWIFK